MATRTQQIKVGVFITVTTALLIAGLLLISGFRGTDKVEYTLVFKGSVLGLYEGGLVHFNGIPAGRVNRMRMGRDSLAHVSVLVDPDFEIKQGVRAKLETYSIATGTMCVGLYYPGPDDPDYRPLASRPPHNPAIPIVAERSYVESVSAQLTDLLDEVEQLLRTVRKGLEGMEEGKLTATIDEFNALLKDGQAFLEEATETVNGLAENVDDGIGEVRTGVTKFTELADSISTFTETANDTLLAIQEEIEPLDLGKTEAELRDQIVALVESFDKVSVALTETMKTVQYGTDNVQHGLADSLKRLNEAIESVRDLADYLREDPSSLVRGKGKQEGGS